MTTTFAEARVRHLQSFDIAVANLRRIVSDSTLCNEMFPPYREASERVRSICSAILRLNGTEQEIPHNDDVASGT